MMKPGSKADPHFDIDDYLNPWIPPNQLHRLPTPISRFLGYRSSPRPDVGGPLAACWSFLGAFCGIATASAFFKYSGIFSDVHAPFIIASFGASAILEYSVIGSPLGQPRNCVLGHFLSALTGICVAKLFRYSDKFDEIRWLAGALSVGVASAVMSLTNTSHPPGGATALLAAVDPVVEGMGWYLLPYVLLATVFLISVALLFNNIQRQFPIFWWTPKETGSKLWSPCRQSRDLEEQKATAISGKELPGTEPSSSTNSLS
ncbi:hypothetical protein DRE_03919 [Drechslerella stenobrocha 248]|uniref:HPP transmembrane region domain-containing protein n=1 Tax=Drechslerella stenobrocha 248 TaxID=1043628 RepID=W7I3D1_9PEZI|nr:hypothetical protein DRE_03919 [Drechslerella stenobrocha 248]